MKRRLATVVVGMAIPGCALLIGIGDRHLDPSAEGGSAGPDAADGSAFADVVEVYDGEHPSRPDDGGLPYCSKGAPLPSNLCTLGKCGLGAVQVSAGDGFACALLDDRTVSCWGTNDRGQLGIAPDDPTLGLCAVGDRCLPCRPLAEKVKLPGPARRVAAGGRTACAVLDDLTVWCWGDNRRGALGHACSEPGCFAATPVRVELPAGSTLTAITGLAMGPDQACLVGDDGTSHFTVCWGDVREGAVAVAPSAEPAPPTRRRTTIGVPQEAVAAVAMSLSARSKGGCVFARPPGIVHCAGRDDGLRFGAGPSACADGTNECASIAGVDPIADPAVGRVTSLAVGDGFACFLGGDPPVNVYCLGSNADGIIAWPPDLNPHPPVVRTAGALPVVLAPPEPPSPRRDVPRITATFRHACAMDGKGLITCWGNSRYGAAGPRTEDECTHGETGCLRPTPIDAGAAAVEISAGADFTLARSDMGVFAWGLNSGGQLGHVPALDALCGDSACTSVPQPVMTHP